MKKTKSSVKFLIFLLYFLFWLRMSNMGAFCQHRVRSVLFDDVRLNQQLLGFKISSHVTEGKIRCAMLCRRELYCNSFNFCHGKLCELNSAASGDVDEASWQFSEGCVYSGTPDDCVQIDPKREHCFQESCTNPSDQFHWSWGVTFETTEGNPLLWDKILVGNCVDGGKNQIMNSNCKGCNRRATTERVLWVLENRSWSDAETHCNNHNGELLGDLGDTAKALMEKFNDMKKTVLSGIPYFYVFRTGVRCVT